MKLPILSRKEIANGIFEMSLGIENRGFSFLAGQYIRLVLPTLVKEDTNGSARLFSIASSPNDKKKIDIIFRASQSGYKETLLTITPGSEVEVEGPWGTFVLPKKNKKELIFIAGGTGISPFLSMLRFASEEGLQIDVLLLYACRSKEDSIYHRELEKLQKKIPTFRFIHTFAKINKEFIKSSLQIVNGFNYYISGPSSMIDATIIILNKLGVIMESIYFEEWSELSFRHILGKLFNDHPSGIAATDLHGYLRYVNKSWEHLTGWSSQEVIGIRTPRILKSEKMESQFYTEMWNGTLKGSTIRKEMIDKRKDNTIYYSDEIFLPIKNLSGGIFGHLSFQNDITERKHLEKKVSGYTKNLEVLVAEKTNELKVKIDDAEMSAKALLNLAEDLEFEKIKTVREKTKLETFFENIDQGIFVVDKDSKIKFINKEAARLLGLNELNDMNKKFFDLWDVKNADGTILKPGERPISRVIETGKKIQSNEYTYCRKNDGKKFPVNIIAAPLTIVDSSERVIVLFRDITEEKKIDKAKSEFVSLASHQLRTPLSTINWYSEVLLNGDVGKLKKEQEKYVETVYHASKRMGDLVNALLNVSRLELGTFTVKPEETDVRALLKSTLAEHKQQIELKSIQCTTRLSKIPLMMIDQKLLHMVFQNIINNAVKYTPIKGRIVIKLAIQKKDLLLRIQDNGCGIPTEQQDQVFTKLFRADNARKIDPDGTGLGLYIAKSILDRVGGKIWFESEKNKGTTFFVILPIVGMRKKKGLKNLI